MEDLTDTAQPAGQRQTASLGDLSMTDPPESGRDGPAGDAGQPSTFGGPQRAADVEADLFRGNGVHAADTVIDHGRVGDLTVRAASVRGTYGRYNGTAREDDYSIGRSDDGRWLILALADGLTSASASHLAATLAVRTAVQQIQRMLAGGGIDDLDLRGVFQSAAYQLRRSAEPLLERDGRQSTADNIAGLFATTLLVAVVPTTAEQDDLVQLARVGDSNAWFLTSDGWQPLFAPKGADDEVYSSAVLALPRLPEQVDHVRVGVPQHATLVLASDGVTDPFGPRHDSDVAQSLWRAWQAGLPAPLEFARQISFRGQSWDDDRTAIAVAGLGGAPASSAPIPNHPTDQGPRGR